MDVDLDFKTDFNVTDFFDVTIASRVQKEDLKKHNVGAYFQNIPKDNVTGLSAIPYKEAEALGYLKIDFLHLDALNHFTSNDQIEKLSNIEPDWTLLESENNVKKLFQIHRSFRLINMIKPKSIEELADCLALIRPGKKHLQYEYKKRPNEIRTILYVKDSDFTFKRSHAIAYATTIVLQLHLLKAGII